MVIHVVQEGETTGLIAEKYGISEERLILENELKEPNNLVIGEALVILLPEITYTIQEGDTLAGIAEKYGVTVLQLLRNNPYLSNREFIYPGEMIVISYQGDKIVKLSTDGYAYPFIDKEILRKTLSFLTYLTIYSYQVNAEGEINDIDDKELIQIAREYGVAPIMLLTAAAKDQTEEISITHNVLLSEETQNQFFDNVMRILNSKGYYGVNISTPYIYPQDLDRFVDFITRFSERLRSQGYILFVTINPSLFEVITSTRYIGLNYSRFSQAVDRVIYIPYELGNFVGIPTGIMAFDSLKNYLSYMMEQIPPEKTLIGVPILGYVWERPYIACTTRGRTITYSTALDLARNVGATILYDEVTKASYFQYISGKEYIVRFRDARGIEAHMKLVPEYGFDGIGIWNIMSYFPQLWLIANSQYDIITLLQPGSGTPLS